jgi:cell division protease FtsH
MDGFYENNNILVIGATNRENMVDEALMRPGRFDLKIRTCLPTKLERNGILKLHLREKKQDIGE